MTRARSPNYPQISLSKAIDLASKLYAKAHTHKANAATVVSALGYTGLNGASMGVISALKKYGLIEAVGDSEFKISKDGLAIIVDPKSSKERATAIIRAAFRPALFAELRQEYGDNPPSADEFIRAFLLKRGFVQSVVDSAIKSYRDTIELVGHANAVLGESSPVADELETDEDDEMSATQTAGQIAAPTAVVPTMAAGAPVQAVSNVIKGPLTSTDYLDDVYKLSDGRAFVLRWPAKLSADEYDDFEAWITLLQRKLKRQIEQ